jgi:hypothetical protein
MATRNDATFDLVDALCVAEWGPEYGTKSTPRGEYWQDCTACERRKDQGHSEACLVDKALMAAGCDTKEKRETRRFAVEMRGR